MTVEKKKDILKVFFRAKKKNPHFLYSPIHITLDMVIISQWKKSDVQICSASTAFINSNSAHHVVNTFSMNFGYANQTHKPSLETVNEILYFQFFKMLLAITWKRICFLDSSAKKIWFQKRVKRHYRQILVCKCTVHNHNLQNVFGIPRVKLSFPFFCTYFLSCFSLKSFWNISQ